jgi:hypothetical protein
MVVEAFIRVLKRGLEVAADGGTVETAAVVIEETTED